MPYEYKQFYRRKLPHMHSPGATLFITFRLADSIPKNVIMRWRAEKHWLEKETERLAKLDSSDPAIAKHRERVSDFYRNWFRRFEDVLHRYETGPTWLKIPEVAEIVTESLHHRDGTEYHLNSYCIMPNHVHVVFRPLLDERSLTEVKASNPLRFESSLPTLERIMKSLKGFTARRANQFLGRTGSFWEVESYDHEVRDDDEFNRIVDYVLNNPVKAGLVDHWQEWLWKWPKV